MLALNLGLRMGNAWRSKARLDRKVQFNDGAGVRWQRRSLGTPRMLEADDAEASRVCITS